MALYHTTSEALSMALIRKLRPRGHSMTIAIPADLAKLMGLRPGDPFEFELVGGDRLLLKLARRGILS